MAKLYQIFKFENQSAQLFIITENLTFAKLMKVADLIKLIENDGWYLARQKGSHRQFKHEQKSGLVTISGHKLSDEVAKGTINSVLKQAGLKNE